MSFIRIKKIAGKDYAYLVENKWYKKRSGTRSKGPRQRVSKYLGRVFSFEQANEDSFEQFNDIKDLKQHIISNTEDVVIKDLINWELHRHGINHQEFQVDFRSRKVLRNNKSVSLKINEGYLNSYTLRRLFNLKSDESLYLAKCFVDAGIQIPKEVFVELYG